MPSMYSNDIGVGLGIVFAALILVSGCSDESGTTAPEPGSLVETSLPNDRGELAAEPSAAQAEDDQLLESDYEILAARMVDQMSEPDSERSLEACPMGESDAGWVMEMDSSLGVPSLGMSEAGVYVPSAGAASYYCSWYHNDEGFGVSVAIGFEGFVDREIADLNGGDGPSSNAEAAGVEYWVDEPAENGYQNLVGSTTRGPLTFEITASSTLLNPEGVASTFARSVDRIIEQLRLQF